MTVADVRVLTAQKIIRGIEWEHLKREPGVLENYLQNDMRHMVADAIVKERLGTFVTSEPSGDPRDPLSEDNAVLRLTVGVVSKTDAARFALDLSEAEERGFAAALTAISSAMDKTLALSSDDRMAHYASTILSGLVSHVRTERQHRPAADWRPMWALKSYHERHEYLFENGEVHRRPRIAIPRAIDLGAGGEGGDVTTAQEVSADVLEAIAWRHAGRHPYTGQPQ